MNFASPWAFKPHASNMFSRFEDAWAFGKQTQKDLKGFARVSLFPKISSSLKRYLPLLRTKGSLAMSSGNLREQGAIWNYKKASFCLLSSTGEHEKNVVKKGNTRDAAVCFLYKRSLFWVGVRTVRSFGASELRRPEAGKLSFGASELRHPGAGKLRHLW